MEFRNLEIYETTLNALQDKFGAGQGLELFKNLLFENARNTLEVFKEEMYDTRNIGE